MQPASARLAASEETRLSVPPDNALYQLKANLEALDHKLDTLSSRNGSHERSRIEQEIANLKQSLKTCIEALRHAERTKVNVFEDVTAEISSKQIILSTAGAPISAKRVTAGRGSIQVLGQMSEETIKSLAESWKDPYGDLRQRGIPVEMNRSLVFRDQYQAGH